MQPLSFRLKWIVFIIYIMLCCDIVRSQYQKKSFKQKVSTVFAFGDSVMDTGNNNDIFTIIRCNFSPYGKDFIDQKSTGRFSNGRIPIDFLAEELGIKKIVPAFMDPTLNDTDLLTGVSFASSGCGYDPSTSQMFFVKSLTDQLNMFEEYIARVIEVAGLERANFILDNSISFIVSGSDDLANTYFSIPFRRITYDVDSYTDLMLDFAMPFFKKLYKYGAWKIGVTNVPPIGCLPIQRTFVGGPTRECSKEHNEAVQLFNSKLKNELLYLNAILPKSEIIYIDLYSIVLDLVLNHTHYGFEVVDRGCCGSGLIEGGLLCNSFSLLCDDEKYLFWDSYHPTERAYRIIIQQVVEKYINIFS